MRPERIAIPVEVQTAYSGPSVELIDALTHLVEASKGTSSEYGVAMLVERLASPPVLRAQARS